LPTLLVGTRSIDYLVTGGSSRRYTYFRFRPDLTLEIVTPRGRVADLDSAIREKRDWILQKYEEMLRRKRVLENGRVMFGGNHFEIVFEEDAEKEEILFEELRGVVIVRARERSRVRELVRRWFLRETSKYVVRKISELSLNLSMKYHGVDVREIKNWGYCTKDGRLSFSWQLIALPERLREYVVLHELAHLSEFSHSRAFKRRLATLCPDYKSRERELDEIAPL